MRGDHARELSEVDQRWLMMGGDLTVASTYGQGSTFRVRLPSIVQEPAPQPAVADTLGRVS